MRTITSKAIQAFKSARNFRCGNTEVQSCNGTTHLFLHGNSIACYIDGEGLSINLCGWNTKTTRERLNGLPGVRLHTKQGQAFLNGSPIDSSKWIFVG